MVGDMKAVVDSLWSRSEQLAEAAIAAIRDELPSYTVVRHEDLAAQVEANCADAVAALEGWRLPHTALTRLTQSQMRRRVAAGLLIEDLLRAYRINISVVHQEYLELCVRFGISLRIALEGADLLWQLGDNFAVLAAAEYRTLSERAALRRSFERADLIREACRTGLTSPEQIRRASSLGIDVSAPYAVVIAPEGSEPEEFERLLEHAGSTPEASAVVTRMSGRQIGLVSTRPEQAARDGALAIGPFVPTTELPASLELAEQIWRVMHEHPSGLFDLSAVTWRIAVAAHPALNTLLSDALLAPLKPGTESGRVLVETLREFLSRDRGVRATAEALRVHQNTLRYRLARFETLTGRDLRETTTIVELAWSLELDRQLRNRPGS